MAKKVVKKWVAGFEWGGLLKVYEVEYTITAKTICVDGDNDARELLGFGRRFSLDDNRFANTQNEALTRLEARLFRRLSAAASEVRDCKGRLKKVRAAMSKNARRKGRP